MITVENYLINAAGLMTKPVTGTRGLWPRASVWLLRLALEAALDRYWQEVAPPVGQCRSRRAQLLALRRYAGAETASRAAYLWWALSRAGHHHGYELAPTAAELRHLQSEVQGLVEALHTDSTERK
ncbi:hypothetical protein GCM10010112_87810 [Actinoplanes lobatus]|uniref:Uncharacterized protein n=1 Tax=Actinoplanes lobatus TaxID=113568 RepID=A0A7W7HR14_9ACTN|nr:hypothetical protein [Actinoplanes lobatus]MBB4755136.1 hypothetical protein [Actinoplanes lobatus]GGN96515.1 hypothetical protein GCM10010112_87810 [Actinoplanes lobatus]GIE45381.1 hypothetical protein Alo02nite_82790 [Actinoplanes lobatus]